MTNENRPFSAVTAQEIKDILGNRCSVDPLRAGYVIGPDSNDKLCHIASCFYFNEAQRKADICNDNYSATKVYDIRDHPNFNKVVKIK